MYDSIHSIQCLEIPGSLTESRSVTADVQLGQRRMLAIGVKNLPINFLHMHLSDSAINPHMLKIGDIVRHKQDSPAFERLKYEGFEKALWEVVEVTPDWVRVIPKQKLPFSPTFDTRPTLTDVIPGLRLVLKWYFNKFHDRAWKLAEVG